MKYRPYINLGGIFSYNFNNKNSLYRANIDGNVIEINKIDVSLIYENQAGYNFGFGIQYGLDYRRSIFIELRYNKLYGISDTGSYNNSVLQFLTGINFSMKSKIKILIILLFCISLGCEKETELDSKYYPYVITYNAKNIDNTGVTLKGEILYSNRDEIIQYGFVWSKDGVPTLNNYIYTFEDSNFVGSFFKHITFDLPQDENINARAFAKTESYIVYGNTITFNSKGSSMPEIESFLPNTGTDGETIIINGMNFSSSKERVKLTIGNKVAVIDSITPNKIITRLPCYLDAGEHKISIEIDDKTSFFENSFTVQGPIIKSFSPLSGFDGTTVAIIGEYFSKIENGTVVTFGDIPTEIIKSTDDTIILISPVTEYVGKVKINIDVTNKKATSVENYEILGPKILNIEPLNGMQDDIISINGNYFSETLEENNVFFGDLQADILNATTNSLEVKVPELYSDNFDISIKVGYKKYTFPEKFFVNNPWSKVTNFSGNGRKDAVGFSIGDKGYIGTGRVSWYYSGTGTNQMEFSDFWEYNPTTNRWYSRASFPGGKRFFATGFSIGDKGYIGTGYDGTSDDSHNDFWEFDPSQNIWSRKEDFPGDPRRSAVGFSINGKGYIGLGYHDMHGAIYHYEHDMWEYDPINNTWTQIPSFEKNITNAMVFVANDKAYIVFSNELWEFDPTDYSWEQKADYPGQAYEGVAFSINNKGYVGTGDIRYDNYINGFWEYDPLTNVWTKISSHYNLYREKAVGFSIENVGYIGTGNIGDGNGSDPYDHLNDFWKYIPE